MFSKRSFNSFWWIRFCLIISSLWFGEAHAQTVSLSDLRFFKNPGNNWRIVGGVTADLSKHNELKAKPGEGILVNASEVGSGTHLETVAEHGDLELELDYMMALGSNSGIYFQGRYEIQLLDSWLIRKVSENDNGSIYGRQAGRQNASRAAGLWQHMKVRFRAPRFDPNGKKTENARVVSLYLNEVLIHDNVELPWQTAGAVQPNEVAKGSLLIQGDHGRVAFRNISFKLLDTPSPSLAHLHYAVYKGQNTKIPDFRVAKAQSEGNQTSLFSGIADRSNNFLIRYTGTLEVGEAAKYDLFLVADGGFSRLTIDGKEIFDWDNPNWRQSRSAELPAGALPFELIYSKVNQDDQPALGLTISGARLLPTFTGDTWAVAGRYEQEGPVYIDAPAPLVIRSFMDVPERNAGDKTHRATHAVSVGDPAGIHYTYDMDFGTLLQSWRGDFLEATPMWRGRGNGSSLPRGVLSRLGTPGLTLCRLKTSASPWPSDTTGTGYAPGGYSLDAQDQPTFWYEVLGAAVSDAIRPVSTGEGVHREITVQNPGADLYALLASGSVIEQLDDLTYLIGDSQYYIKMDSSVPKPLIRSSSGGQELIVPLDEGKLSYSIWF
ncbi:hypothetical protein DYBT9275_00954 [Dyadobacter sp. CECT 9275]|uniref:PA14 domain-containing protein n=1 Tax=Dyadobacter helix TaxID=2822344 RepID=A0A916NB72_9BACT|nr:family 16 glycoside hydrolase [Dyadobacter sp. CECT 9275]CAG4992398.1 hypothetical protein DYBT9275_00954 [Dyadobacter sp. CECT 9275]